MKDFGFEAIERLRAHTPERVNSLSLKQITTIVAFMLKGESISEIAKRTRLSKEYIVRAIIDLGTWLGQTTRSSATLNKTLATSSTSLEIECEWEGPANNRFKQLGLFSAPSLATSSKQDKDLLLGVDFSKSVVQIMSTDPDESLLRRWLMRRYHSVHQVLDFGVVALVHRICQLNRLVDIEQLPKRGVFNSNFARVLVEAYDLLEVTRKDAVTAVGHLTSQSTGDKFTDLEASISTASWLHQAVFNRLSVSVESNPSEVQPLLARLARDAVSAPNTYLPANIAELNDGQVLRLAQHVGLRVDSVSKEELAQVRSWVAALDMSQDSDILVASGVLACRAGLGNLYQKSLEKRAKGSFNWAKTLNTALSGVEAI